MTVLNEDKIRRIQAWRKQNPSIPVEDVCESLFGVSRKTFYRALKKEAKCQTRDLS